MPIYKGKTAGTFRVVVWARGRQYERTVHGERRLAVIQESEMRLRFGAKEPPTLPADPSDASELVWVGGAKEYVYFVQSGNDGPIKIGYGKNAGLRLRSMQIGTPIRLRLLCVVPGGRLLERAIHRAFDRSRLDGEWFKPTSDLLALVAELSAANKRTLESTNDARRVQNHG